jgi:hypothetical protein
MAAENPQWNEIACPKDFNSAETDKVLHLRVFRKNAIPEAQEYPPGLRAGRMPFEFDVAGLQALRANCYLAYCLQ